MQKASSPGPRRRIIWSVVAGIVIVVLALGVYNAVVLPGCRSCHDRGGFRAATASAPHGNVDCRSCHVPVGTLNRAAFSLRQPFHMLVPRSGGTERDAAAVPDSRCLPCHEDVVDNVVESNGIRIAHGSCAVGASCTDCHSATAHGRETSWVRAYDMDTCLTCHVANEQTECDLCHEGRRPENRIKSGTFAVTHGSQWQATHGMGDGATCTVCHQPADCVQCHGAGLPHEPGFVQTHAGYAKRSDERCANCHEPSFCDACHGMPMPHGALVYARSREGGRCRPSFVPAVPR